MPIEFDIKLTPKDMYRFNMYQVYSGFHGWFSIAISIVIFVTAWYTCGEVDVTYTVLYIALGIVFLFYMPVSLLLRSKHSLAASEVLSNTLHYKVEDKGLVVSQGDASAELLWEQIYKMVATKSNVLVYSNRTNAYIIPKNQIAEQYDDLTKAANERLPKFRVKMK